jgi:hypothetical protein
VFTETLAVYCENHTEHINSLRRQNAEILYVKAGGIYNDHCALMAETCLRVRLTFSRQNPVFNKIAGMTILVPRIGST